MDLQKVKDSNPKDAVGIKRVPFSTVPMVPVAEVGLAMLEGALKYAVTITALSVFGLLFISTLLCATSRVGGKGKISIPILVYHILSNVLLALLFYGTLSLTAS